VGGRGSRRPDRGFRAAHAAVPCQPELASGHAGPSRSESVTVTPNWYIMIGAGRFQIGFVSVQVGVFTSNVVLVEIWGEDPQTRSRLNAAGGRRGSRPLVEKGLVSN
jgi:hypothetical protein